jgi:hypothetical protein
MLLVMSSLIDRSPEQKRRSFVVLVAVLVVAAAVVAFVLSRGGGDGAEGSSTPSSGASASGGVVTLQTACGEIAPDMPLRVDALTRTAQAVRADIATMESQGNTADAAQATQVAVALENLAEAERTQQGVERATRELGDTVTSIC